MAISFIDIFVRNLSENTGVPYIQLHFVFSMFLVYPFAFIFRFIKGEKIRLLCNLIFGILLQYNMIGNGIAHLFFETLCTYLFIYFLGRKVSAFYLVIFNFAHLTYLHFYDYWYHYGEWTLGAETVCMVSLCKFSIIAFNYEDGAKEDSQLSNEFFKKKKLLNKPSFLQIFSYIFFFPTCLIGPSIEFSDFMNFMKLEDDYKSLDYSKCNVHLLYDFPKSFILIGLTAGLGKALSPEYTATLEFKAKPFIYKFLYVFISVAWIRCKYYTGWQMAETAMTACGFNYIIKDEKGEKVVAFDRVDNCNIYMIETSISNGTKMQYWNRNIHLWLKYYVYIRLQKPERSNAGFVSFITFITSAFWHGVYPNYYLFFFNMFLLEQICKYIHIWGYFKKMESDTNKVRKFFFWFMFFWAQDYAGLSFVHFSWKDNLSFYSSFYYIPNIFMLLGYVYVTFIGKRPKREQKPKTQ